MAGRGNPRVRVEQAMSDLLEALTVEDSAAIPSAVLEFGVEDDEDPALVRHLGRFVFTLWGSLGREPREAMVVKLGELSRRAASMEGASRHVRTALDYLFLWSEADRYFHRHRLGEVGYREIAASDDHVAALSELIEGCNSGLSTQYGASMLKGMLVSIRDRSAAADLFRAARAENPEFATAAYLDHFGATYLEGGAIREQIGEIRDRRAALLDDFELLAAPAPANEASTLLLFSCDPTFFAVYFPYWASIAEYLRGDGVSLHFILTGDTAEAAEAIKRGEELLGKVSRLRRLDPALLTGEVSFSRVPLPGYVEEERTFHACARYLVARRLATGFAGRVVILDMDMAMWQDPLAFLDHLATAGRDRLAVAVSRGLPSLIPARRYMANTFPLPPGEIGDRAMQHIEDYMYAALSAPTSWTLDQNALDYAVGQIVASHGSDALLNLNALQRPFTQVPANKFYEVGQKKLAG